MFSRRYGFNTVSTFIFEMFLFSFFFFQRSNSSTLSYIPTIGDHRKVLTCKAENPDLQNSAIQDSLPLQVHCKFIEMATTIILKGSEICETNIYKYLILYTISKNSYTVSLLKWQQLLSWKGPKFVTQISTNIWYIKYIKLVIAKKSSRFFS